MNTTAHTTAPTAPATGPDDGTLHGRFLRGLAAAPGRPAFRVGDREVTYAEAHRTALTWAGALCAAAGDRPGAVGVLASRDATAYLGTLAALYTGAAVVPLHPGFPPARLRQIIAAAGVQTVVTDERGAALLPAVCDGTPHFPVVVPDRGPLPGRPLERPRTAAAGATALILFTSGSTGRPKGVPLTHGATAHYFATLDARYDFTPQDVFSQTFDLTFDCAMFDLFCAWGAGACVVPPPAAAYRAFPEWAAEQGLTVWFATPSSIGLLRRTGGLTPGALPGLRWSFFAGEALRAADVRVWQAAAPGSAVENLYGPTELTVTVTVHRWSPQTSPARCVNGVVPIGRVHEGLGHFLAGSDGTPVPDEGADGSEGELCVSGPQTTSGYLDPDDDHGRFLQHDGRTWYRTGDRVRRLGGGELAYLGRADDQVQVQGVRVELAEVDHAVRSCAGVEDAATVAVERGGTGELAVFYTGRPAAPVALARALRPVLPPALIPRHFQHLDELPLNANRKTDRKALRARATAAPTDTATPGTATPDGSTPEATAPQTMTPQTTAQDPAAGEAAPALLHQLLDAAAAATPDAPAVRDARESWSYRQLADRSRAAAHWLAAHGVARGDRVLVQLPNVLELVALLYGCGRRGAAMVPLNPAMKEFHLRSVAADSGPRLAVVPATPAPAALDGVPARTLDDLRTALAAAGPADGTAADAEQAEPSDLGVLIYTSGSTAAPKGVMCPQAQMTFAARAIQRELCYRPDDVVYCRVPLSFDYGLFQILLCALSGAELVLAGAQTDVKLLGEIREFGATVFPAVPSLAQMLVKLAARDPGRTRLRMFTNTGAALQQATIEGLREAFPDASVVRMFGITECKRVTVMPPHLEHERPDSVGRPLPGTRVAILDDDGRELPPGRVGEITVTGPNVMAGYWRAPEITARTFRRDPATGQVRLHTGDYGHVDTDGFLYFEGRRDDMFKRRGTRMSTTEIEAAAMDVPGVRAAAALAPADGRDLVVCVTGEVEKVAVLRELTRRLEPAKVPAACLVLDTMPLTPNGKHDRKQLAALFARTRGGAAAAPAEAAGSEAVVSRTTVPEEQSEHNSTAHTAHTTDTAHTTGNGEPR